MFKKPKFIYFDQASSSIKPLKFIEHYSHLISLGPLTNKDFFLDLINKLSKYLSSNTDQLSFVPNATCGINEIASFISKTTEIKKTIYLSKSEHLSNVLPWLKIHKDKKWPIAFFDLKNISKLKIKKNSILAFSAFSNIDGFYISWNELIKSLCFEHKPLIIVDATQFIQHHDLSFLDNKIDYCVFSAHKFFGPNGIGVVLSKENSRYIGINKNNFLENNNYELDWKGLSAWNICFDEVVNYVVKHRCKNEQKLLSFFKNNFPHENKYVEWINTDTNSLIFLLKIKKITAHDFAFLLEKHNFVVRTGLSCSFDQKYKKIQHKIVRVSLSFINTSTELKKLFLVIKKIKINDCF